MTEPDLHADRHEPPDGRTALMVWLTTPTLARLQQRLRSEPGTVSAVVEAALVSYFDARDHRT